MTFDAPGMMPPAAPVGPPRSILPAAIALVLAFAGQMAMWSGLFFTSIYPALEVAVSAVAVVLLGIWLVLWLLSLARQRGQPRDMAWRKVLVAALLIGGPVRATNGLRSAEVEFNKNRAQQIGLALRQFNQDTGRYPQGLDGLEARQMPSIPSCWYGLIPRPFEYSLDGYGKPHLSFVTSPTTALEYEVEHSRWSIIHP